MQKILVANRGEIACRILATAKKMQIPTVAVYSEADANALHVALADEACCIGPAAATQSYLHIENIVAACQKTGADSVHPGYGFLSENADFVAALQARDICFIGPPRQVVAAMGDKIKARKLAQTAGVLVIPGWPEAVLDDQEAEEIATEIGFPVMIKSASGGGGKGMRIAHNAAMLKEQFARAVSEAKTAFGDGRVFLERFIANSRHIEIQILGDNYGHLIHLGERECSIQRRNQKVLEEAPSPFFTPQSRQKICTKALSLARQIGYQSAGTVEFIVDRKGNFYFLEMNTRLQVEHPVTELITGIDLVEQMIRIARGEKLALTQEEICPKGWAVEARIYAEDARRNFLPCPGRLIKFRPPEIAESPNCPQDTRLRLDTGVKEGDVISPWYDPMIAKLTAYAPNRRHAINLLADGLAQFTIEGCGENIDLLSAILAHEDFGQGKIATDFIEKNFPGGFHGGALSPQDQYRLAAMGAFLHCICEKRDNLDALSPGQEGETVVLFGEAGEYQQQYLLHLHLVAEDDAGKNPAKNPMLASQLLITAKGRKQILLATNWRPGLSQAKIQMGKQTLIIGVADSPDGFWLRYKGARIRTTIARKKEALLLGFLRPATQIDNLGQLRAPMPGIIVSIHMQETQQVEAEQALIVMEAMKMENILRAPRKGRIAKIHIHEGQSVCADALLVEYD